MNAKMLLHIMVIASVWFAAIGRTNLGFAQETDAVTISNGVVCWTVTSANGQTTQKVKIKLTVEKPGKTSINAEQEFPAGSTAPTIAAHFVGLLAQAGWTNPEDYTQPPTGGPCISFYGISKNDGSPEGSGVRMTWGITKVATQGYSPTGGNINVTRGPNRQAGRVDICVFGVEWNVGESTLTTSSACASVYFNAADSAGAVLTRMETTLEDEGWTVERNLLDGSLNIINAPVSGYGIVAFQLTVEYPGASAGETVNDHWVVRPLR